MKEKKGNNGKKGLEKKNSPLRRTHKYSIRQINESEREASIARPAEPLLVQKNEQPIRRGPLPPSGVHRRERIGETAKRFEEKKGKTEELKKKTKRPVGLAYCAE